MTERVTPERLAHHIAIGPFDPEVHACLIELAALRASVAEKDARIAAVIEKSDSFAARYVETDKQLRATRTQLADAVGTLRRLHNATLALIYDDSISDVQLRPLKVAYHDAVDCLKRLGVTGDGKHE